MKWLVPIFIGVPALEFYLLIQLGIRLGALETLLLIVATGTVGAAIARAQGLAVLRQVQETWAVGTVPAIELIEGACVLLCGALLVTPGMVTDVFGLAVMLPPLRRPVAKWLLAKAKGHLAKTASRSFHRSGVVINMAPDESAAATDDPGKITSAER